MNTANHRPVRFFWNALLFLFVVGMLFGMPALAAPAQSKAQKQLQKEYKQLLQRCRAFEAKRKTSVGVGLKRRFLSFHKSHYISKGMLIFFKNSAVYYPAQKGKKRQLKAAILAVDTEVGMLTLPRHTYVTYLPNGRPLYAMITEQQTGLGFTLPPCTSVEFHHGFGQTVHIPPQARQERKGLNKWLTRQQAKALRTPLSLREIVPGQPLFWGVTYRKGAMSVTWGKGTIFTLKW